MISLVAKSEMEIILVVLNLFRQIRRFSYKFLLLLCTIKCADLEKRFLNGKKAIKNLILSNLETSKALEFGLE